LMVELLKKPVTKTLPLASVQALNTESILLPSADFAHRQSWALMIQFAQTNSAARIVSSFFIAFFLWVLVLDVFYC